MNPLVQGVFERESGGNNLLRDSFVTDVYSHEVSERMALAERMGHRPQTAERIFNLMPGVERQRPAAGSGLLRSGAAVLVFVQHQLKAEEKHYF
mmetsp:Transcript_10550/g.32467  ORF Transcript_10550/g.32467 Transcript_10550/m.32467 type:complete len:94 (-) Transcript_10550:945-1226(-)